jgi:hypothetical protein
MPTLSTNERDESQQIFLNFNANKIRWIADSNIINSDTFCVSGGENKVGWFIFKFFILIIFNYLIKSKKK